MTKRTSAKYKIDRRMGENIWGRPKSPVNRREYGPGQHGQRRKGKLSDFGLQLRAKQKLKGYYGDLTEKQFRRIFSEAERVRGDTGENLIGLLERRLDMIVYRAKFAPTIFAARQIVNHGHILFAADFFCFFDRGGDDFLRRGIIDCLFLNRICHGLILDFPVVAYLKRVFANVVVLF